ncbi:MAG TPA: VTT domain-containing protein [Vicinamibacterales bacterium]|nr:VTT domain-containing protein [Vicinamibacterales bacterium]
MSGSPERVAGRSPARDATAKTGPGLKLAAVVAALALLLALGWLLPIGEWTIALADRVRGAGAAGVVLFIAAYVTATVALLPGSVLTLAAGFAYGPIGGLLVASPASVLAATAAFLLGRTALRGWVQRTIAGAARTRALSRAIGKDSFRLILLLRLSPRPSTRLEGQARDLPVG